MLAAIGRSRIEDLFQRMTGVVTLEPRLTSDAIQALEEAALKGVRSPRASEPV